MARQLALAFAVVVSLAVVLLGGLTWRATGREVARLSTARHRTAAQGAASVLGATFAAAGSWRQADLYPAQLLAARSGATLAVRDAAGALVSGSGQSASALERALASGVTRLGSPLAAPIVAGGTRVGTALLRFPLATPAAERRVRRGVERTILFGGLVAVLLAAAVGAAVARRITRPLRDLTRAAGSLAAGDLSARAGGGSEPAELGELARAFDGMAETVDREDALRRAFAADVAHELRTPLAIAQGELESLVDGIKEPTPERLRSLHEEMLRLARIVEDVETLAAAEAARFKLERQRVDLAEIARDAVTQLHDQADDASVTLTTHLESASVDADRTRLEQIARNLLGNAIKFTPAGGSVTVAVRATERSAELIVEDTGPGIDDDELPHVFERFWRGRSSGETPGSGVGLAVAAELARAHGGRIDASTRPGGGSRFTVSLPRG
jgi:two-component system, OmpR family, sensor histidine kinase BaeS